MQIIEHNGEQKLDLITRNEKITIIIRHEMNTMKLQ